MDTQLIKKLVSIAQRQIDVAQRFKKPRIVEIQKSEDMYANKVKKQLKNRFNIPLPVLGGFVDTLKSKIDDKPVITYKETSEEDYKRAKKITALWETESGESKGRWAFTDRMVKGMAIFSGRGIYKLYASSDPKYQSHFEGVDYYDFLCEPQGGAYLENHLFCGQQNIFKTLDNLERGAESKIYLEKGVSMIKSNISDAIQEKTQEEAEIKFNRFKSLKLDPQSNNYVGETLFNLTEWYMNYKGTRYYLLFDPKSGIAVRAEKLKDVFQSELYPYVSWATHEDPYNFWSKAPVDDIRPVAESMRIIFNQALDNVQKRNWGMRAFDSNVFPDPAKLQWRPDGLVPVTGDPKGGIYEFDTPDNSQIVVNLFDYLDNFLGQKSGITAGAQGASDKDTKVGVYYGDLQQVADRLGLYNKAYKEAWAQLGTRYVWGLKEHLNEKQAVKIIGNRGVEFDEIIKEDANIDTDVVISGGSAEVELDEVKKRRQTEVISAITANPNFAQIVNQKWLLENMLKSGEFEEDEIRKAMDSEISGNADLMSEAAQAIQDINAGKTPDQNRGATMGFVRKILDFAYDKNLKLDVVNNLIEYAMAHIPIAEDNEERNRMLLQEQAGTMPQGPEMPRKPQSPPIGQEGMTAQRSQMTSNQLSI